MKTLNIRKAKLQRVGTLFYDVISSPILLWKFYLDVLARIVLNHCDKFILLVLLSGFDTNGCRNSTVCNSENCFSFKKVKIREIVFLHAVTLSKKACYVFVSNC